MGIDTNEPSPEREQTDESLRVEREKTDRALADRREAVEDDADMILQKAREDADSVLLDAREKADQRLVQTGEQVTPESAITEERVVEDAAVRAERAAADESLRRERRETAGLLTSLLPLERDKTDRYLLTERTRSDDALANRDDFLGIVSHDLRDLLGGIVVSASLLAKRAPASEPGKQIIEESQRIQRYAARMNRLIGDLVDVASIDAGKLAVSPSPGDMASLMDEVVDTFRSAASAKGILLEKEKIEHPLWAEYDHDRILQVFANLITNSIKFTPLGGTIRVRGERAGTELRFAVSDTGTGMPADMLETVFDRFAQVGKNDRRGLGLGLYISRCIVEAHGGRIWAENEPGGGSRVCCTLPAARADPGLTAI